MVAPKKGFIHPAVHIPNEVMNALIKASSESNHPLDLESLYSKLSALYIVGGVKDIWSFWQLALIAGLPHDIAIENNDTSVRDEKGRSIAHYAALSGNPDALAVVLAKYPDLAKQTDKYGRTIAHYAAWSGNLAVLSMALSHLKLTTLNLGPVIRYDEFDAFFLNTLRDALEANTTLAWICHPVEPVLEILPHVSKIDKKSIEILIEIKALLTLNKLHKDLPFMNPDELRPDKITPQSFLERAFNYQPKGFFSKGLSIEEKKMLNEVLSDLNGEVSWIGFMQFMNAHVQPKNPSSLMRDLRTFAEACQTLKLGAIGPNAEPDLPQSCEPPSIN